MDHVISSFKPFTGFPLYFKCNPKNPFYGLRAPNNLAPAHLSSIFLFTNVLFLKFPDSFQSQGFVCLRICWILLFLTAFNLNLTKWKSHYLSMPWPHSSLSQTICPCTYVYCSYSILSSLRTGITVCLFYHCVLSTWHRTWKSRDSINICIKGEQIENHRFW